MYGQVVGDVIVDLPESTANVKLIADDLSVDSTFVNCNNLFIKKKLKRNKWSERHPEPSDYGAHYENLFLSLFLSDFYCFLCLRFATIDRV